MKIANTFNVLAILFYLSLNVMLQKLLAVHNENDLFASYYISVLGKLVKRAVKGSASDVKCVCKVGH